MIQTDFKPLEDVRSFLGSRKVVTRPAQNDLVAVLDVELHHLLEVQDPWNPVDQGEHDDAERILHRRMLVQVVQHHFCNGVALELDDEAHAIAVRLVADIGDTLNLLVVNELNNLFNQPHLIDLVGQFGDHNRLPAVLLGDLDQRAGPNDHLATTRQISLTDAFISVNDAAGREVGRNHMLHEIRDFKLRVPDERNHTVDHLAEVLRRNIGRHPDGDAGCAVDKQVRNR